MGTLTSDAANRDRQFNGRIMDTSSYPTSTFVLTQPIALPTNALSGEVITVNAQGDLTLRGTTRPVQFPLQAKVEGATFTVVGNITIVFNEWGIPEPSLPGITVEPDGLLEFSLVFVR
jgi:polyisoprenoid-binding protein YceI